MKFALISLFPEMFSAVCDFGVSGRAVQRRLIDVTHVNPRDFTEDVHRTVDDKPYGGGPGMILKPEPLFKAVDHAKHRLGSANKPRVVLMSPQGKLLTQDEVQRLSVHESLIVIAGRYEGVDERVTEALVDEELSLGDYVISGGELAAMVLVDAITRLLPGALGHPESARQDSFVNGLLDHPHYTRPECYAGKCVPDVLSGGNHQAIRTWREQQSLGRTWLRRPDLIEKKELTIEQRALLEAFINDYRENVKPPH